MAILEEQLAALKQNDVAKEAKTGGPKRTPGSPRKSGVPTYALVVPEENEMLGVVARQTFQKGQSDGSHFISKIFRTFSGKFPQMANVWIQHVAMPRGNSHVRFETDVSVEISYRSAFDCYECSRHLWIQGTKNQNFQ